MSLHFITLFCPSIYFFGLPSRPATNGLLVDTVILIANYVNNRLISNWSHFLRKKIAELL